MHNRGPQDESQTANGGFAKQELSSRMIRAEHQLEVPGNNRGPGRELDSNVGVEESLHTDQGETLHFSVPTVFKGTENPGSSLQAHQRSEKVNSWMCGLLSCRDNAIQVTRSPLRQRYTIQLECLTPELRK